MYKFLVPIDFSKTSSKALKFALNHMDKEVDKMILLNVYPVPDLNVHPELSSIMAESYLVIAKSNMNKLIEKAKKDHGSKLDIAGIVVPGLPIDKILDQIKEEHLDFVIMGKFEENEFSDNRTGNIVIQVIQKIGVPVILVPKSAMCPITYKMEG